MSVLTRDFHLLPTSNGPVVYHAPSHRFFGVEADIAEALRSLEAGVPHDGAEEAETLLLATVDSSAAPPPKSVLGERPELSIFYLFVSQDCNLDCLYCYGDGGVYQKRRMKMDDGVADAFIDNFLTGRSKRYMINFFGGEPLMNLPQMERVIERTRAKAAELGVEVTFNINTNGTMWNDRIRELLTDAIDNITVSLDGPKPLHDSQRLPTASFSPHDRTVRMLGHLREMPDKNVLVRTVITKNTCDKVEEIYTYNQSLSPGSVGLTTGDVAPENPVAMTAEDHAAMTAGIVATNVANLCSFATDDAPQFYDYTYDLFEMLFFRKRRPRPCNAGGALAAVSADGDIYPCHRFVGYDEFKVGNVRDESPLNERFRDTFDHFRRATVDTMDPCSSCWARYLCGGCCYVTSWLREGDTTKPPATYCHLKKSVYHSLLATFSEIMGDPPRKAKMLANVKNLLASRRRPAPPDPDPCRD